MFKRIRQLIDRLDDRAAEELLWQSRLDLLVSELKTVTAHGHIEIAELVKRELVSHVRLGIIHGYIPHNLPKSNKKLLEIK